MDKNSAFSEAKFSYRVKVYTKALNTLLLKDKPNVLYMESPHAVETRFLRLVLKVPNKNLRPISNKIGIQACITKLTDVKRQFGNIWDTDWRSFDIVHLDTEHTAAKVIRSFPCFYTPMKRQVFIVNCSVHGMSYEATSIALDSCFKHLVYGRARRIDEGRYKNGKHGTAPMAHAVYLVQP